MYHLPNRRRCTVTLQLPIPRQIKEWVNLPSTRSPLVNFSLQERHSGEAGRGYGSSASRYAGRGEHLLDFPCRQSIREKWCPERLSSTANVSGAHPSRYPIASTGRYWTVGSREYFLRDNNIVATSWSRWWWLKNALHHAAKNVKY